MPSVQVLDQARSGVIEATTDAEALQKVLHYYHRQGATELGVDLVRNALVALPTPFPITGDTIDRARQLLLTHPRSLDARDAVHAAVVLEHRLEGVISADRGFDAIGGVRRFDPRDL